MGLVMTSFTPKVQCQVGDPPIDGGCSNLLDTMVKTRGQKSFGNTHDAKTDVWLPKYLFDRELATVFVSIPDRLP